MKFVSLYGLCLALMLLPSFRSGAQNTAISTNVADYAMLGTLNVSLSHSAARHWSLEAGAKYNPFSFNEGNYEKQMQNRQILLATGLRYWPWHVFSGWWFSAKAQFQEYNQGGILSPETSEGDRFGGALGAGYTYMLHKNLNLDFGLGFWAGYDIFTTYDCPVCGVEVDAGKKFFVLPNEVVLALTYVF
ncbi:MAG: DUF3575 domain-containing protein [Bacteroidales bacterium]|nr:DUF3575 domain-containing protein [Bacteroidales bacterium]